MILKSKLVKRSQPLNTNNPKTENQARLSLKISLMMLLPKDHFIATDSLNLSFLSKAAKGKSKESTPESSKSKSGKTWNAPISDRDF